MLTLSLILLPLLAAGLIFFVRDEKLSKQGAMLFAIAESALMVYTMYAANNKTNLNFDSAWSSFGARFTLGMDGISMLLVLLTVVLVPFIIYASYRDNYNNRFYSLVLMMQSALIGVFTAMDGFLFYIFWELA